MSRKTAVVADALLLALVPAGCSSPPWRSCPRPSCWPDPTWRPWPADLERHWGCRPGRRHPGRPGPAVERSHLGPGRSPRPCPDL